MQLVEKNGAVKGLHLVIGAILLIFLVGAVSARSVSQTPNWDKERALEVARVIDTQSVVADLRLALSVDDPGELMAALHKLEARDDLPWPAREAALLRFMQELRSLPSSPST